ncbi:MAG TPA: hypothetical protein DDW65_25540 [Firmicutes bacterium]|jgi:VanZ family protein|nr:hypothetical protein [Bacillota bacterium]
MDIKKRLLSLIALTFLLIGIIAFLAYTSINPHWGSGYWEQYAATHYPLSFHTAAELVYWTRKSLHFLGYGTLGLLSWLYFYLWKFSKPYWMGIVLASLIAALDEYLQSRVPFRNGNPEDVLLDICGIIVITGITRLFLELNNPAMQD